MTNQQWFGEKSEQVSPSTLTAFGIRINSRYGNADELMEMLRFCKAAAQVGLEQLVESVFYDSKADICSFEFVLDLQSESAPGKRLLAVAEETISQFMWLDDRVYHGAGFAAA